MAVRTGAVVVLLCLVLIVGTELVATPAEARAVQADHLYAAPNTNAGSAGGGNGITRGRWNHVRRSLQQGGGAGGDAAHKREVPGGPDPQHHN
ncbi:hypothetical protein BRADI_2g50150v3 [Brachypodium distachyon]|uniref:Uncharacterized protein n=1 Tax=Brachypodium distachyon TaxID=15368 RepID=I1HRP3_BRADI|nr:hypothetical protein BRADI_2g50150v3 [Brachypodium distachyon]